jgi:Fe-S cluster biogenesis protein NfuA
MDKTLLYERVKGIIDKEIRPFIESDGGKIVLKEVLEDGTVYVQLAGACAGCPGATMTLKGGVERILKMKIDGVKEVKLAY